jgi:amino acid transporter
MRSTLSTKSGLVPKNSLSRACRGNKILTSFQNPTKTLKWSAPLALLGTTILYILVNIAYFAAATKKQILASKLTTASLFFENVFGSSGAGKALSFLVAVSAFGNLIAVLIGQSRVIRECGRSVTATRTPSLNR